MGFSDAGRITYFLGSTYRAVQKFLKITPLGTGVWECVGVGERTSVRPFSHTQPRSARAFSVEVGASRLRSSSRIGNSAHREQVARRQCVPSREYSGYRGWLPDSCHGKLADVPKNPGFQARHSELDSESLRIRQYGGQKDPASGCGMTCQGIFRDVIQSCPVSRYRGSARSQRTLKALGRSAPSAPLGKLFVAEIHYAHRATWIGRLRMWRLQPRSSPPFPVHSQKGLCYMYTTCAPAPNARTKHRRRSKPR